MRHRGLLYYQVRMFPENRNSEGSPPRTTRDRQKYPLAHTHSTPYPIRYPCKFTRPHPSLPKVKSNQFPPGSRDPRDRLEGPPLRNLCCTDTHRGRDSVPTPPCPSAQAWGGWLPHQPKGNDSKGPEKEPSGGAERPAVSPLLTQRLMSLPPLR